MNSTSLTRSPVLREGASAFVLVEMSNRPGVHARVDRQDFERLIAEGYPRTWFINGAGSCYQYVRFAAPQFVGDLQTVARAILGAPRGRVVKYRDGDRLNLTRQNLYLCPGNAKGQTPVNQGGEA